MYRCVCLCVTCVIGDRDGDMVGDICLPRLRLCSAPGDSVKGLMGAGRRRGELLMPVAGGLVSEERRRDEWMEGLLRDECSWELQSDAWMEGLLREDERQSERGWVKERQSEGER